MLMMTLSESAIEFPFIVPACKHTMKEEIAPMTPKDLKVIEPSTQPLQTSSWVQSEIEGHQFIVSATCLLVRSSHVMKCLETDTFLWEWWRSNEAFLNVDASSFHIHVRQLFAFWYCIEPPLMYVFVDPACAVFIIHLGWVKNVFFNIHDQHYISQVNDSINFLQRRTRRTTLLFATIALQYVRLGL